MAYYPDLSRQYRQRKVFKVGWLDAKHPFETACAPNWLIEKLWIFCRHSILSAGGFHECDLPYCRGPYKKVKMYGSGRQRLTKREIREKNARDREKFLGPLAKLSRARRAHMAARFVALWDEALRQALRGYAKMSLAVNPKTRERVELGWAEIRVFGDDGKVYAAPNMIYHYVTAHHYKPPDAFVRALRSCPCPPSDQYLARMAMAGFPLYIVRVYKDMWEQNVPGFF
jgi:hypothetical protein